MEEGDAESQAPGGPGGFLYYGGPWLSVNSHEASAYVQTAGNADRQVAYIQQMPNLYPSALQGHTLHCNRF